MRPVWVRTVIFTPRLLPVATGNPEQTLARAASMPGWRRELRALDLPFLWAGQYVPMMNLHSG